MITVVAAHAGEPIDEDDLDVVATASSSGDARQRCLEQMPDVALIALDLDGDGGRGVCRSLAADAPVIRSVLVGDGDDAPRDSIASGAFGFVGPDADLAWVVRRAAWSEALMPPAWAELILGELADPTPTEREVLQRLAGGAAPEAVANLHEVTARLVNLHAGYALVKLQRQWADEDR
jgi:DNA-binding NarL/FixJ family response regulator